MALSKSDFYSALQPRIRAAFEKMQSDALTMKDPNDGPGLILRLSQDLATAITEEVDTFIKSGDIDDSQFGWLAPIPVDMSTFTIPPSKLNAQPKGKIK